MTAAGKTLEGGFVDLPSWTTPAYAKQDAFVERPVVIGEPPFELPGLVTLPRGGKACAAAVLIHASSRHDGDETIGGVKVFKDLAWGLASAGVAVLRYEKRTKRYPDITEQPGFTVRQGVIDDVISAVDVLAAQPEVDPARISLVGHGVGGMLAPRIAAELDGKITALALLAANSRPVDVVTQGQLDYLTELVARMPAGAGVGQTDHAGRQVHTTSAQLVILRRLLERMRAPDLRPDEVLLAGDMKIVGSYFLELRHYDAIAAAHRVALPIFVGHPENDYQITLTDYEGWKAGLARRPRTAFKLYRGLNHMFVATTGPSTPEQYLVPDHVAPHVIDELARLVVDPAAVIASIGAEAA
ncbi:MAG TPA: hypothetical protein VFP84_38050 [Kofleriaceae bacterium]|nr:hypothetical protein [Kofleriaceae bacterium]